MSIPALRQPKFIKGKDNNKKINDLKYVVLTLKNEKKLVITCDAYNGIITGETYKCVFCNKEMHLDPKYKELHKVSPQHKKVLEKYPYLDEFSENLLRQLNKKDFYCTICNVVVGLPFLKSHIGTESHSEELNRAVTRASVYKPCK